jgi:hypothetical protein
MGADQYACGQHCDTASMLSTSRRFASENYPTGGVGVDRLWCFIAQAVKDNHPQLSNLPSAFICDEERIYEAGDE